ncbi:hypothetical protein SteCoe_37036 [Stentor coeruleus]|uniref:Uncharacterized protein n=1 Tax=Stentor coeruleus TaxID=5963 RepID=A0A1R2ANZ3_9CILI|nr:hypothetical protein SteCoe_37036 [Stentor coeruleus]
MNSLILEVHRKKEIALFSNSKHSSGPYFIVPSKWYHSWLKYLKGAQKPARIFLHTLLDSKSNPKQNLEYKKDYYAVPKKVWDYLKSSYGSDQQIQCPEKNIYSINQSGNLVSNVSSRTTSPRMSKNPSLKSIHVSKVKPLRGSKDMKSESDRTRSVRSITVRSNPEFQFKTIDLSSKSAYNGVFGLQNSGCICYMNSALQCLVTLTPLTKEILKSQKSTPLVSILKEFYSESRTGFANNKKIEEFFKTEFPPGKQHDMPEYLRKVFEILDQELASHKKSEECDPWREYERTHSRIVVKLFSGLCCSKITCLKCSQKKENYEPYTTLTLEVCTSLCKSMEKYLDKEIIQDEYYCMTCDMVTNIEKQYLMVKNPNILIIQLKRFVTTPFSRKINMHCDFNPEIELMNSSNEKIRYTLRAVGVHTGNCNSGHYTAFCKRNGKWFFFDDAVFQEVDFARVKESQAYILIYSKKTNER